MAKKVATRAAEPKSAPAPAPKAASRAAGPKAATKAELFAALAEKTGLGKKEITSVFSALHELIGKELGKTGPGQFVIPGLMKLTVVRKPATKARPGKNPFTGEAITIQARPARNVVRAIPMKALRELA